VYIYLSNDNLALGGGQVEVYFDDFKVEHIKSPVIASQDYYPYGLTFNSYTRERSVRNKYLYNAGSELQDDLGLGWYETFYRTLDPALGVWGQIDPKLENFYDWTPYNYAYDNPSTRNDPKGDCEICLKLLQSAGEGAAETVKGLVTFVPKQVEKLANAYSELAKGNIQPAVNMTIESHPLTIVANQFKRTANIVKNTANGNYEAAAKDYGAHLADGAIAWATAGGAKSAPRAGATTTEVAGSIRNVNKVGGTTNCVNCAIATDATLAGKPASALNTTGPQRISVLETEFNGKFNHGMTAVDLTNAMSTKGQRGIVFGNRGAGQVGHVFNVVNQEGNVRFLDGQSGGKASLDGYTNFSLLKTN